MEDAEIFAFAGLWERWKDKVTGEPVETYTIITTDPNKLMEPFHDRMPVILRSDDYQRWLTPGNPARLPIDLLRPYPDDQMTAWRVGNDIGYMKINRPELVERVN